MMCTHFLLVVVISLAGVGCSQEQDNSTAPVVEGDAQVADSKANPPVAFEDDASEQTVSKRSIVAALIYKGKRVEPGEFMAVVGITRGAGRLPICTGTVIESDIVLTAAHCICDQATSNVYIGDNPKLRTKGNGYYRVAAWESAMHCDRRDLRTGLDLALLRTEKNIQEATPIRFASDVETDNARFVRVVGFGAVDTAGAEFLYQKQEADVPIVSVACRQAYSGESAADIFGCLAGSEIVAGKRSTPDTCRGDSGGPLLVSLDGHSKNAPPERLRLAGVTSRPTRNADTACGDGGIYERLTPQALRWIDAGIKRARNNRN